MKLCDFKDCTGCSACANACPLHCITMAENEQGFICPKVDTEKCIDCKKCEKACPSLSPVDLRKPERVYASWCKDEKIHSASASGGLATAFGKRIIENDGVVFGAKAEFKENRVTVYHTSADNFEDALAFQGSKYVQSEIGNCFAEIKDLLTVGKQVLFCGTPCQVAGLISYLGKDYDNLITVDIVCHGVPSQSLLNRHICEIFDGKEVDLRKISFRENGRFALSLTDSSQNILYNKNAPDDSYITGFLSSLFYRESCYSCNYAKSERVSDITIGDFWGLGKDIPFEHTVKNGISLCMINTKKGAKFWKSVCDDFEFEEREISEAVNGNAQLRNPSREKFCNRNKFFKCIDKMNFDKSVRRSAPLARLKYKVINLMK